jgi:hypothetical protein
MIKVPLFEVEMGGIHYRDLTEEQKRAVEKFYGRKPIKSEKTDLYYYYFDKDGKCTHAG